MLSYKKLKISELDYLRESSKSEKELIEYLEMKSTLLGMIGIDEEPQTNIDQNLYKMGTFANIKTRNGDKPGI